MCLALHSHLFLQGIKLLFDPNKIPLARFSTRVLANLVKEALFETIPTKSVDYLSIGVSRWASAIFESMKEIQGSVYE